MELSQQFPPPFAFQEMVNGLPGEEVALELTLRVVADIGLVV